MSGWPTARVWILGLELNAQATGRGWTAAEEHGCFLYKLLRWLVGVWGQREGIAAMEEEIGLTMLLSCSVFGGFTRGQLKCLGRGEGIGGGWVSTRWEIIVAEWGIKGGE